MKLICSNLVQLVQLGTVTNGGSLSRTPGFFDIIQAFLPKMPKSVFLVNKTDKR
jgi:hypothetical protein